MKVLKISKGGLSIAEHILTAPVVTIGRSPVCDVILRAQGANPVHFLLEWVGVGAFDSGKGRWILFDISHNEDPVTKTAGYGGNSGVVISEKPVDLNHFQFAINDDPLAMTPLTGGMIHERVTHIAQSSLGEEIEGQQRLLEVIKINTREQTVVDVIHHVVTGKSSGVIPSVPELKIQWSLGEVSKVLWEKTHVVKAFSRGIPVEPREGLADSHIEVDFRDQDFLCFNFSQFDVYLRFVEAIQLKKMEHDFFKSQIVKLSLFTIILAVLLIYFILTTSAFEKPIEIKDPPRIARIEVLDMSVPPPPRVEPSPEVERKVEVEKTIPEGASGVIQFKKQTEQAQKPKTGLNAPVPHANTNNVGLLGMMKSGGGGKSKGGVSANMILNSGVVSKTVSGKDGGILLHTPPAGVVDLNAKTLKKGGGGSELGSASTTLKAKDSFDVKSASPIAGKGSKTDFSVGSGAGSESDILGGNTNAATEIGGKEGFVAKGGLDKEAVRLTLIKYRRQIRTCYEKALLTNPRAGGRIVFQWYISSKGPVTSAVLKSSEAKMPSFEGCVEAVIKSIVFPAAANGQSTIVIYPFVFQKT